MSAEQRSFFSRPGEEVTGAIASSWARHQDRREVIPGQASIIGLQTPSGLRLFRLDHAYYYDDAYTRKRFPNTRGPELASMQPGEVVGYPFHQTVLTFIKVDEVGSAANIQLDTLTEVDRQGAPLMSAEAQIRPGKVAQLLDLQPQQRGQITPFNFRNTNGFLISVGGRELSSEEIQNIEEEILS